MNTFRPDPFAKPAAEQRRLLSTRWFLAAFLLAAAILAALSLLMAREFFIMLLAIGPVLYAAFNYPRWVYRVMILAAFLLDTLSAALFPAGHRDGVARDFLSTLALILLAMVQVALLADIAYRLVRSREKVERALQNSEERYRSFLTRLPGIAFQEPLSRDGYNFIHGQVEEITGYLPGDFLSGQANRGALIHPDDRAQLSPEIEALYATPNFSFDHQYRITTRTGQQRWLHEISQNVCDPDGRPLFVQGTIFDVTAQKEVEEAQRESQAHFRSLFENSPISLWDEDFSQVKALVEELVASGVADLRGYFHSHPDELLRFSAAIVINDVNRASLALIGVETKEELFARIHQLLGRVISESVIEEICAIAEGRTYFDWEGVNDMVDGKPRYQHVIWTVAPGSEQTYKRVIVAIDDITESKRTEEALLYLSTHDILTGLYNRAFFDAEMERLKFGRAYPISILFADMDGLKATNDSLGHNVGDELLRRAARVMREAFRGEDIVARIGGDEFGVLLPAVDGEAAQRVIQRVRLALAHHNELHPGLPPVRFSIGCATANPGDDLGAVLRQADERMYREKPDRRR